MSPGARGRVAPGGGCPPASAIALEVCGRWPPAVGAVAEWRGLLRGCGVEQAGRMGAADRWSQPARLPARLQSSPQRQHGHHLPAGAPTHAAHDRRRRPWHRRRRARLARLDARGAAQRPRRRRGRLRQRALGGRGRAAALRRRAAAVSGERRRRAASVAPGLPLHFASAPPAACQLLLLPAARRIGERAAAARRGQRGACKKRAERFLGQQRKHAGWPGVVWQAGASLCSWGCEVIVARRPRRLGALLVDLWLLVWSQAVQITRALAAFCYPVVNGFEAPGEACVIVLCREMRANAGAAQQLRATWRTRLLSSGSDSTSCTLACCGTPGSSPRACFQWFSEWRRP